MLLKIKSSAMTSLLPDEKLKNNAKKIEKIILRKLKIEQ